MKIYTYTVKTSENYTSDLFLVTAEFFLCKEEGVEQGVVWIR